MFRPVLARNGLKRHRFRPSDPNHYIREPTLREQEVGGFVALGR